MIAELGDFGSPSSKSARKVLADLGVGATGGQRRATLVLNERDDNVWKSFRNFPGVKVRTAAELCAFDVVAGGLIVAQPGAMEALAARVGQADNAGGDA